MDDIWNRNAALIRSLYQKHTLQELKPILETQHGFPTKPLSTYETKIRDVIKARKNLKKEEWKRVHMHALSRGYKEYDVSLSGKTIRTDLAWKKIRWSGAHKLVPHAIIGQCDLPPGVTITPLTRLTNALPPLPQAASDADQAEADASCAIPTDSSTELRLRLPTTSASPRTRRVHRSSVVAGDAMMDTAQADCWHSFIEVLHDSLPWNHFRRFAHPLFTGMLDSSRHESLRGFIFAAMPNDGFFPGIAESSALTRFAKTAYPSVLDLRERLMSAVVDRNQLSLYQEVVMLTYVISNGLYGRGMALALFSLLGAALYNLHRDVAMEILKSHSYPIRAIWDRFVTDIMDDFIDSSPASWRETEMSHLNAIGDLVKIVIHVRPDWTISIKDRLLYFAASLGNSSLVRLLLQQGAQVAVYPPKFSLFWRTPIICATVKGYQECVGLLINNCDVNAQITVRWKENGKFRKSETSHFALFVTVALDGHGYAKYMDNFTETLHRFLDAGADVDAPYPFILDKHRNSLARAYEALGTYEEWFPTCLDISFYSCYSAFFPSFQSRSFRNPDLFFNRHAICTAAREGKPILDEFLRRAYVTISAQEKKEFLQLVLVEQFCMNNFFELLRPNSIAIASALIQCGVPLKYNDADYFSPTLLVVWFNSVQEYGLIEDLHIIFEGIVKTTPTITSDVLFTCAGGEDAMFFEMLDEYGIVNEDDIVELGAEAVVCAATHGNYEAVSWLLGHGFDINTETNFGHNSDDEGPRTIISSTLSLNNYSESTLLMCQYFVNHGAQLRHRLSDNDCFGFLQRFLRYYMFQSSDENCLAAFQFFENNWNELELITKRQWNTLLRSTLYYISEQNTRRVQSEFWELFNILLDRYFTPDDGPTLASAIRAGCGQEIAERMIAHQADVNAIDSDGTALQAAVKQGELDLAYALVEMGAHVDAPAGSARFGTATALSEACLLDIDSTHKKDMRMGLIRYLVQNGADVNNGRSTESCLVKSLTPLQACAWKGNLDATTFLLHNLADPNLIKVQFGNRSSKYYTQVQSTLDIAARMGRLDIAQLLVRAGAISCVPGSTGYDGAIEECKRYGFSALEHLLYEHIRANEKFFKNPDCKAAHGAKIRRIRTDMAQIIPELRACEVFDIESDIESYIEGPWRLLLQGFVLEQNPSDLDS